MSRRLIAAVGVAFALLALSPHRCAATLLLSGGGANTVYLFDGVSATPFASDPDPSGPDSSPTKMHLPVALAYAADGNLLVLNEFSHNVLKFNGSSGAFIGSFIDSATLSGAGISDPDDMEVGPDGKLYIMSHFNEAGNNIHKFDASTGAYLGVFASSPPTHHQHGFTFGPGGLAYQGNVDTNSVERFTATGLTTGTFASDPGLTPIFDVGASTTSLYVTSGNGVARFNIISGAPMGYLAGPGPGESYWGIAVDGSDLWLSNLFTGTLRHYNATSGAFIGDTVIGGGATDILPMVPEPSAACLILAAGAAASVRRRRAA